MGVLDWHPEGQNDFYDLVYGVKGGFEGAIASPDWFYLSLKASETGILPQEELESAKRSGMSPEQYAQEFECSFLAAITGSYYGHEIEAAENENRLTKNVYDKDAPGPHRLGSGSLRRDGDLVLPATGI
jgi:hypothetical protein